MEINPLYLDRWDYLISELKKEGIYVHLVVFSFHLYAKSADNAKTFADRTLHKMMMYLDGKWEMDRFRYAVNTLFHHVNPYTSMAWKDDPVIAFVEYYNEQALGLGGRIRPMLKQNPEAERHLLKYWRAFLEKKYGRPMKDAPIPPSSEGKAGNDFALFWQERAVQCAKQCEAIIRAAGYRGLVTNFSAAKNLGHSAARWEIAPVVDIHAYFNHPSNWMRRGSIIAQNSSIAAATGYWKNANSVKLTGRPFLCGEYNHCFWNPYRYELGMVYGGYSALQGYGALMVHEQAVLLDDSAASAPVNCFSVGNSPLLRASQFLTACLFQRGDVRTSPHQVSLLVPRKFWTIDANAEKGVSSSQATLGLLAGDIQHLAGAAQLLADLEHQRGLADTGRAAHQHQRALHRAAAQHPIQLPHAGGEADLLILLQRCNGGCLYSVCDTLCLAAFGRALRRLLHHGVPRAAHGAAARPFGALAAALRAEKDRFCFHAVPSFV